MSTLIDIAAAFLTQDDWAHQRQAEPEGLLVPFQGDHGSWNLLIRADDGLQQLLIHSLCPLRCPEARRPALMEFITRANQGMVIGNFELDLDDGELRFKTAIDVEDSGLDTALVRNLLYPNCLMMDRYLPGVTAVIAGERSPAHAIAAIEGAAQVASA